MGLGWHGIERKVSTLLALGKHACTVGLGGAVEGPLPSGTLRNRSEALLRRGESRAKLSGGRDGGILGSKWGQGMLVEIVSECSA